MSELNISEAQDLWQKRLSNNCEYRIASRCKHILGKDCNIIRCPLLYLANLKIIFKFKELKNK